MTVSTVVDHNDYTGNGVTTSFPYTFRIFKKTDLAVSVVDLSENITLLILDTDYTVTNAGGYNGGSVVLNTPLATGWQISIARELEPTQETDLRNQGKFFPEVHEDAFDKLTMLIQQVGSMFRLALRKPSSIANWYDALSNYIRNVRDPRDPQDAATKNYVDSLASTNLSKTLRTPEPIQALPNATVRANKIIAFDNSGQPFVTLPPSGSATDVLIELAKPTGEWLIGKANTLADLLNYDVRAGYLYETEGYYSPGDGGGARYLISSTQGDIPELAYLCDNGLYAILQHNGTISIEQLGGKGVSLGQTATDDSWPAFYKAYKIKNSHVWDLSVEFIAGKSAYYCSKPILLTTGMTLRTPNTSWICKIIYGGGTVTADEVPDVTPPIAEDPAIIFSNIHAHVLVVNTNGYACYYASLSGFSFRNADGVVTSGLYGVYAPYMSKVNISNCRHDVVNYGIRWINNWGGSISQCIYMGLDTSAAPVSGSVGVWGEPAAGTGSYTNGGTSLILDTVGASGFQTGFKITNQQYTTMNSCYSEKGNDRALEFTGCDGVVVNAFGLENLVNTLYSCIRFNNSRVTINNLVFAYNNKAAGGNVFFSSDRSKVNIVGISFGRLTNSGSAITLFNTDGTAELSVDGPVDIPSSLINSTGYSFAAVGGKFYSDNIFTGTLGIANGSATTDAVTFTANEFSYKFKGGVVWFNYYAAWTSGSGTDMQVYGFPRQFSKECTFHSALPVSGKAVYARPLLATNRVRISGATDASNTTIPTSGALFIQGEYVI